MHEKDSHILYVVMFAERCKDKNLGEIRFEMLSSMYYDCKMGHALIIQVNLFASYVPVRPS